jgi:hypothetical protein
MGRIAWMAIGGVILVAIALFLFRSELGWDASDDDHPRVIQPSEPTPEPVVPPRPLAERRDDTLPAPSPAPQREPVALPPLARSDAFVRERLEAFGLPAEWIAQDDLVRRLAVVTDGVTRGEWPRRPLRFLQSPGEFRVIERDGKLYADPRNATRYEADLDLLESIDPAAAARFLVLIEPLLSEALGELGLAAGGRVALREAIDAVVDTPVDPGPYELIRPKVFYAYADPAIEARAPFEKQLLRLGPENAKRLKTYLGRVKEELEALDR